MEPRIVEQAPMAPGQCLFSQDQEGPWIDTGVVAPWIRPYGYISARYVEDLARNLLDMVPGREVREKAAAMEAQLEEYAEKVQHLQKFVDAHETLEQLKQGAI